MPPSSGILLLLLLVAAPLTSCFQDPDHASDGLADKNRETISRGADALENLNTMFENFKAADAAWKTVTLVIDESKHTIEQAAEETKDERLLVENNKNYVKLKVEKALQNLTEEVNKTKKQVEIKLLAEGTRREASVRKIFDYAKIELKQDPKSNNNTITNAIMEAEQEVENMSKQLLEEVESFKKNTEIAKTTFNASLRTTRASIKSLKEITNGKDTAEQEWKKVGKQELEETYKEINDKSMSLENAKSVAKTALSEAEELESNINTDTKVKTTQNTEFQHHIMEDLSGIADQITAHANVAMTEMGKRQAMEMTKGIAVTLNITQQLTNLTRAIRVSIQHVKVQAVQAKDVAGQIKTLQKDLQKFGSQKSSDFITLSSLQNKKSTMEEKYNIAIENYELAKGANDIATEEVRNGQIKAEEVRNNSTSFFISVSESMKTNLNTLLQDEKLATLASATTTATESNKPTTNKPTKSLSNGGRLKSAVFGVTLAVLALVTIAAVLVLRRRRNARTASITSSTDLAPAL